MTLVVPENHGLSAGAEVKLRGMPVGDVRRVELAVDGSHVAVDLRISEEFRGTVTDTSRFWIARPRLSGALLSGQFAVEDLSALLSPFVGYHTEGERGTPVPDGYRVAVSDERPEIGAEVPAAALEVDADSPVRPIIDGDAVRLVARFLRLDRPRLRVWGCRGQGC